MRRALLLSALALAGCAADTPRPAATPPPAPTPSGTLFLAGRDPGTLVRVDVAAGTAVSHHVKQLGGGDPPYLIAYTGGRVVVFALGRTSSLAPDLGDPRSLGEAWFFVPSVNPGRVWNILLRGGDKATQIVFRGDPALAWSSSGWLYYGVGAHHIGAWRPGQPARELPMRVDKFVAMAAD
jgi:hypothetical protein